MYRFIYILFLLLTIAPAHLSAQEENCYGIAWTRQAPVEYISSNRLHHVKTYYFNANPGIQSEKEIEDLRKTHDSLTTVVVGNVFMNRVVNEEGVSAGTWYWWPVKEQDKTYLLAYLPTAGRTGAPPFSYYSFTFRDGTQFNWAEPHESPYNHNSMFLLVDGTMQAYNKEFDTVYTVEANKDMHDKLLNTPLYYVTKYNGYKVGEENGSPDIKYEPVLQYVFTEEEGERLMKTMKCLSHHEPVAYAKGF